MDDSDEFACQTIYWIQGGKDAYTKELSPAPFGEDLGAKLQVFVTAIIVNILEVKELDGFWQPKVVFTLSWLDKRLQMQGIMNI